MEMLTDKRRTVVLIGLSALLVAFIILFGPMDCFHHGYYADEVVVGKAAERGNIDLAGAGYEITFSPQKKHMIGAELFFQNLLADQPGEIVMSISNEKGIPVETIHFGLKNVKEGTWYKVRFSESLKKLHTYRMTIRAEGCASAPQLRRIDSRFLPEEIISGDVQIAFAYAQPTFTLESKIIICVFLLSGWLFLLYQLLGGKEKSLIRSLAAVLFMTSVLSWNYMYNSMDNKNESFPDFQRDSEMLVNSVISAKLSASYYKAEAAGCGLGCYYRLNGIADYGMKFITDDTYLEGFSREDCSLAVITTPYTEKVAAVGNEILFGDGTKMRIEAVAVNEDYTVIQLNGGQISCEKNGSLNEAVFLDSNGEKLPDGLLEPYLSQYGLQGKLFSWIACSMGKEDVHSCLHLICSMLTAFVFTVIVVLISRKYNRLLAGCFYVTFWLSPWIVNFARNLYWVEFTWFLPTAVGLFCAWKISEKKCRILCYVLSYLTITVKCLCGYEYISGIMIGLIAFLVVDLLKAVLEKNKQQAFLLLRTTILMGCAALFGFVTALCIHAQVRSDGNLIVGLKTIFIRDVLRRTIGSDLNNFSQTFQDSYNASIWETCCKYFHFSTEILPGIPGNAFPLLCVTPLCIFYAQWKKRELDVDAAAMYGIFFLAAISWFALAKAHSFIHTHMNYVLWYYGFVQICIYTIINWFVGNFGKEKQSVLTGRRVEEN